MRDQVTDQHIARAISRQGWLSIEEAAKAQGVSVRTVRRDERRRMRALAEEAYRVAVPARQGRMTPEQKARVAAAQDFLVLVTREP